MERGKDTLVMEVVARPRFEEHDIAVVEHDGRPLWSARQVARALGYAQADQVVVNITHDWSEELDEGTDYIVFRGPELAALKGAAPELVDARAPSLLMLTESGVNLVALLSRQPKARQLRRWLASEVLPTLRKTGSYSLAGYAPAPMPLPDPSTLPKGLQELPGGVLLELLRVEGIAGQPLNRLRDALGERGEAQGLDRKFRQAQSKLEDLQKKLDGLQREKAASESRAATKARELASSGEWYSIYLREHKTYSAATSAEREVKRQAAYDEERARANAWVEAHAVQAAANNADRLRARKLLYHVIEWCRSQGFQTATRNVFSLRAALERSKSFPGRDTAVELCKRYHLAESMSEGTAMLQYVAELVVVLQVPPEADETEAGGAQ